MSTKNKTAVARLIGSVVLAMIIGACTESSVAPPAAPSPLNPERIGELMIACSADIQVQSLDGQPVPIAYPAPATQGGEAPVTAGCTPASGTAFPIARSRINCTASDKLGQAASCSFDAVVLPPPMLSQAKFLTFGDSLTAGVVAVPTFGAINLGLEIQNSYPVRLQSRLNQAYPVQTITTVNEGLPGELAADARSRLQAALTQHRPDVVILMEGTNDLGQPMATDDLAVSAMASMMSDILSFGADAIVATIPPVRPSGDGVHASLVGPYNDDIRALAVSRGIPVVDVFSIISNGSCSGGSSTPCIGVDNIHPTVEGYQLMADAFFQRIVELYDVPVTAPTVVASASEAGPLTERN